jgi:hypothetical protein
MSKTVSCLHAHPLYTPLNLMTQNSAIYIVYFILEGSVDQQCLIRRLTFTLHGALST